MEGGLFVAHIFIPIVVVLIVTIILSISSKHKSKVDKGFKINYFSLSYRRKMIRTLVVSPGVIIATIALYFYTDLSMLIKIFISAFLLIVFVIQLSYNFHMWKKRERYLEIES